MSDLAAISSLSQLNADVRDALTDWLADCDLNWQAGRIEFWLNALPAELQPFRGIALAELVKIDIERLWRQNHQAKVESYLEQFPELGSAETVTVDVLLTEWEARRRQGQLPRLEDFAKRFPAHADSLRLFIQRADEARRSSANSEPLAQRDTSKIMSREVDSELTATNAPAARGHDENENAPSARTALAADNIPEAFSRFRIVRKLGQGGMGDVYLADDTQLHRQVALKVPYFDRRTQVEVLERFDREAKAAAKLDHPNICRVHEVGESDGHRFLVLEFIDGPSLAEAIKAKPVADAEAIRLVQLVAGAVGAAHDKKIIHRDLKPANIMLTADGQPKVTDFGLARLTDTDDQRLTQSGMILGTPAYMPPEQLTGELVKIGPHSDVYSLGVILIELLTGHLPHDIPPKTPIPVLCARILTEPATPPTQFRPDLDPRLEAILLKATAKSHTDRFASMSEFSAALQAVLDAPLVNEPRNKATRTRLSTVVASTFAAAILLGAILWFRNGDAVVRVEILADDVEVSFVNGSIKVIDGKTEYRVQPGTHRLHIKVGNVEFDTETFTLKRGGNPVVKIERRNERLESRFGQETIASTPLTSNPTRETKQKTEKDPSPTEVVSIAAKPDLPQPSAALQELHREQISVEALTLAGNGDPQKAPANLVGVIGEVRPMHRKWISSLVFSPDNRWLASGCFDTTIMLRDPMSAEVQRVLRGHTDRVTSVAFSKDSQSLVSGSEDGTLKIWSVEKDTEPETLSPDIGQILAVAATKDGRFLAAGGKGGVIKLWKWGEWKEPMALPAIKGTIRVLAFSPDGETLASGWGDEGPDARIRLHRTSDREPLRDWVADKSHVTNLAFHPDGKWLGATGAGAAVKLWEAASGKLVAEAANWTSWPAMAFHPNGKSMYACLHHNIGHLLELPAMTPINGAEKPIHAGAWGIVVSAFRPDGKAFVVGTDTGGVHLWETEKWQRQLPTNCHSHYITTLAVHPNGRTVLTGGDDFVVRKWDVTRPTQSQLVQRMDRKLLDLAYSPDGSKYVSTSAFEWHDREQRGFVWDAESGQQLFKLKPPPAIDDVVFSPDGKVMAAGDHSTHCVHLWDAKDGSPLHQFPKAGPCFAQIAFTRDGQRLAMATADTGVVKVLDVVSGDELHSFKDEPSGAVALSADGRYLASGHLNGSVSVWDLSEKAPKLRTLTGHTASVTNMRFTPDNKKLISSSEDGTLRIWNIEHARVQQQSFTLGSEKQRVIFDLDLSGQYVFATGDSPVIFVLRLSDSLADSQAPAAESDRRSAE